MKSNNKHNAPVWGRSLRQLKWDNKEDISLTESLISDTVHEWYDAKHRETSVPEIKLINSHLLNSCPICGSINFVKNGKDTNGIQRYICKQCNRTFSPINNTIFDSKKIPISEWIEYLLHLFEFHSITSSARDNRNAYSTGKYWLIKVFSVLKHIQDDVILKVI